MTLMFGNLTLAFVQFGTAVQSAFAPGAGPGAMQALTDAADDFKNAAAQDALYLVFIGMFPLPSCPSGPPSPFCHRRVLELHKSAPCPLPLSSAPDHPFAPILRASRGG